MRCFAGVLPDAASRRRLGQLASQALQCFPGARRIRDDNIHLTLAFIGELADERARRAAREIAALPLEPATRAWRIDRVGRFARAGIVWAGGDEAGDAHPARWAGRVRDCLAQQGIAFDARPFVAHVTLLRDVPARAAGDASRIAVEPFDWPLEGARLLVSTRDPSGAVRYTPLATG